MTNNVCFDADGVCPDSREYLHHKKVKTVRCGRCGLLNPQFKAPAAKDNPISSSGMEIIDVEDSPPASMPPPPPPAKRRGTQSTHIPNVPDFKLGYAEEEREVANKRVQDRKTKTGFTRPQSVVHFAVGVAHFHWDELAAGEGNWTVAFNQWSVDEDNRDISSQRLLDSILKEMRLRTK